MFAEVIFCLPSWQFVNGLVLQRKVAKWQGE